MGAGASAKKNEDGTKVEEFDDDDDDQQQQQLESTLTWPLPRKEREKDFIVNTRLMRERYTLSADRFKSDESAVRRSIKRTQLKFPTLQKTLAKTEEGGDSRVFQSSHVQMITRSDTNMWAGISPSTEVEKLIANLNVTHMEYNEIVQQRLDGLSKEAERILGLIIEDTSVEQSRLLEYAQNFQAKYEELQRKWLQKYLIVLDQWRTHELAALHEKVEDYKADVNAIMHDKLGFLNAQVEAAQSQIFYEEQRRHAQRADLIVTDMEKLAEEYKANDFATEATTDVHLRIQANAGNKRVNGDGYYDY